MPKEKKGLDNMTIAFMVSVALFYDFLQIPLTPIFMGWLVSIFAGLTFYVWFKMRGVSFMSPKRAGILGGGFIIELVPLLNVLPAWALAVVLLGLDSKIKKVTTESGQVGNVTKLTPKMKDAPAPKPQSTGAFKKAA
jgi:hypothetical protein